VGLPYQYQVLVLDPDAGDSAIFGLLEAPAGATLQTDSGIVRWLPPAAGDFAFRVRVQDEAGDSAVQAFTVHVSDSPLPPYFTSTPATAAVQGQAYAYQATASDPNGDVVTFGLASGPSGMTVTLSGAVAFTPSGQQVGSLPVRIFATDGQDSTFQAFVLVVANVNDPPVITSTPPTSVVSSAPYAYQVQAADPDGDALLYVLEQAPFGMAISPTGLLQWPAGIDRDTVQVRLLVHDGQGGEVRQAWRIDVLQVSGPLTADIATPGTDTVITSPVPILGTATGTGFHRYLLQHRPAGGGAWTDFASSSQPIQDGTLGTFDPTLLPNGLYEVRLATLRSDGSGETATLTVTVEGGMKLGQLNFAKTDLSVKAPGMDLALVREYDSRRTGSGDFGPGWHLAHKSVQTAVNMPLGEGWTQQENEV
jgi:hypothetical protein